MEAINKPQQTLHFMVCNLRNQIFNAPDKKILQEKLPLLSKIAEEYGEEKYLCKLLREEFK
jgi:hypothetical protein